MILFAPVLLLALFNLTHDSQILWQNGIGKSVDSSGIHYYNDHDETKFFLEKKKYFRTVYSKNNDQFSVHFLDKNNKKRKMDSTLERIWNASAAYYFYEYEKKFNGEIK